jgi:hypothetical protein
MMHETMYEAVCEMICEIVCEMSYEMICEKMDKQLWGVDHRNANDRLGCQAI